MHYTKFFLFVYLYYSIEGYVIEWAEDAEYGYMVYLMQLSNE
jgi:hypothetical protein